jgi:succinoglycan biosynthesis transport protein ExoP
MLQRNVLQTGGPRAPVVGVAQSDQTENGGIGDFIIFALGLLRRQYLLIIVTAALAMAACVMYLFVVVQTAGPQNP